MQVEQKVKDILSAIFETENINENSSADNIEKWDSIHHLDMVLSLEDEFNISIPNEDVGNLQSYKIIVMTIKDLLNA